MSDQITINITPDPAFDLNVEEQDQNVYINPISLNEGVINHSVTHISGGSDELSHNSLGGLQGGASGQFYHLTSGEYANLVTGQVVRPNETGVFVTKSETGAFYAASNPSGFITGVDLSAYVTGDVVRPSETGAFYAASNPSGFITGVDLSNYATLSYTTGISGSLQNQISDLNNQTGDYALKSQTGNFITQSQTGQFYSSSNPSGYTPTGYVTGVSGNLQDQITILNNQTGSFYPRNNPSGYITGVDLSFSGNYYTKTESEFRYVNATGAETILGDKTFHDKVYINSLYVTGLETIVNTINTNVASNYLMLNLTGGAVDGGIFFVTGSGLTGINDSGAIIGFDHSDKFKFGIGTRASDLSVLDTIASVEDMTGISGSLQTQISTLNSATGSYVLASESGQFYPSSNPSGFITGIENILYTTGGTINGNLIVQGDISASGIISSSSGIVVDNNKSISVRDNNGVSRSVAHMSPFNTLYIGTGAAGNLLIQPTQNVGVGTVIGNPASKLTVHGNASIGTTYSNTAAPTNGLIVAGNVGIGTSAPTERLTVSGNISASGNINTTNLSAISGVQAPSLNNSLGDLGITASGTINIRNHQFYNNNNANLAGQWSWDNSTAVGGSTLGFRVGSSGGLAFTNSLYAGTIDTRLTRLSAGVLAIGNGVLGNTSGSISLANITAAGNISASGNITSNNLVYNTGNQPIAGVKTFSNNIVGNGTANRLPNQTVNTSDSILTRQLADERYYIADNVSSIIGISMFI